jgi:hypothetical protein
MNDTFYGNSGAADKLNSIYSTNNKLGNKTKELKELEKSINSKLEQTKTNSQPKKDLIAEDWEILEEFKRSVALELAKTKTDTSDIKILEEVFELDGIIIVIDHVTSTYKLRTTEKLRSMRITQFEPKYLLNLSKAYQIAAERIDDYKKQ